MPTSLPPLPPDDDAWPPRRRRSLHPRTVDEIERVIRLYMNADTDVSVFEARNAVIRAVQRDPMHWRTDEYLSLALGALLACIEEERAS